MELHASLNTLDYIVLGIILLSGLFAIMTGFVREMYSLFNWVASYFIAVRFYSLAVPFVSHYISNAHTVVDVAIFVVFCISFIVLAIVGMTVLPLIVQGNTLTMIDRSLGFVFGLVRGVLIVCLVYLVAGSILWPDIDKPPDEQKRLEEAAAEPGAKPKTEKQQLAMAAPHWLVEARTRPMMRSGAEMLKEFIPEKELDKTTDTILEQKAAAEGRLHDEIKNNTPSER